MKKQHAFFPIFFTLVMLICVLFIVWYIPAVSERRFLVQDVQKSLETSQGRERKQQHEYDETVSAIPAVQAELDRILPLTEAALQEVQSLKSERKQLREQKKLLETQSGAESFASKETEDDE